MMTHDEMIEVILAHKHGKQIEGKFHDREDTWSNVAPSWNFRDTDYRVKPEPKYRPYQTMEEVPVGKVVVRPNCSRHIISGVFVKYREPFDIFIHDHTYSAEEVLRLFKFEDGSPCGIKEE